MKTLLLLAILSQVIGLTKIDVGRDGEAEGLADFSQVENVHVEYLLVMEEERCCEEIKGGGGRGEEMPRPDSLLTCLREWEA